MPVMRRVGTDRRHSRIHRLNRAEAISSPTIKRSSTRAPCPSPFTSPTRTSSVSILTRFAHSTHSTAILRNFWAPSSSATTSCDVPLRSSLETRSSSQSPTPVGWRTPFPRSSPPSAPTGSHLNRVMPAMRASGLSYGSTATSSRARAGSRPVLRDAADIVGQGVHARPALRRVRPRNRPPTRRRVYPRRAAGQLGHPHPRGRALVEGRADPQSGKVPREVAYLTAGNDSLHGEERGCGLKLEDFASGRVAPCRVRRCSRSRCCGSRISPRCRASSAMGGPCLRSAGSG